MKKHNQYSIMGLKALQRAAAKVAEDARKNNYTIPVWKNGRIEHEIPEITSEQASESTPKIMAADPENCVPEQKTRP